MGLGSDPLHSLRRSIGRVRPVRAVTSRTLDLTDTALRRRDPLTPPRRLMFVGDGDFRAVGEEFKRLFVELGGLRPENDVLDVGSGIGRMAVPLTGWLKGRYEGLDIVQKGVQWCSEAITPRFPNFGFQVADVYSHCYNRRGSSPASDYRYPFEDDSFDFVFLTSVFTHLLPADAANYIRESARVLRPGGTCFATFFLLNEESEEGLSLGRAQLSFAFAGEGCRFNHERVPEAAVAYPEANVFRQFEEAGLRPVVHHGTWSGRANGVTFQDIVVAASPEVRQDFR
jgi:SAM-dependent methyltransferase